MKNGGNLVSKLFRFQGLLVEHMRKEPDALRYSITQLKTLRFINELKNPTMKNIADFLCVMPPSATAVVDRLIADKFVKRASDRKDRRVVRLVITAAGRRRLRDGFERFGKIMDGLVAKLSYEERTALSGIFEKLTGFTE